MWRSRLSQGFTDPRVGFWLILIPTMVIAIYLSWRGQQLPKPKTKSRASGAA
jgi:hypothetical protein